MSFMLTRMFAYFTLVTYLMVGTLAVRLLMPEMTTVEISSSYLEVFKKYEVTAHVPEEIQAPEMVFAEIEFPVEKNVIPAKKFIAKKVVPVEEMKIEKVAKNELPFQDPVALKPVLVENELDQKFASLYVDFKYEAVAEAESVEDEVSTKLASDAEPEFFEYPVAAAAPAKEATKKEIPAPAEKTVEPVIQSIDPQHVAQGPEVILPTEEVAVDDLIVFDYSKAEADLKEQTLPTVSKLTTHGGAPAADSHNPNQMKWEIKGSSKKSKKVTTQNPSTLKNNKMNILPPAAVEEEVRTYPNRVTIHLSGTNLQEVREEVGFELRFQDDLNDTYQDYNNGSVTIDQELASPKMTRSMTVLKRGYAPTNTDLILEEGVTEAVMPVIDENTFNELLAPFESRGPIGAVLIELDDSTKDSSLDVPYSKVMRLDEDMKVTEAEEFRYQLFLGVQAGNAMLSYRDEQGGMTSKIIHVHERELTFETNFFENVKNETIKLLEEDLLSKDKTPLIISSREVREFATENTATKISNHSYKLNFEKTLLGGRRYVELGHQEEPIFVGIKENNTLVIPSENFMRYILSRFEGSKLGNRCLVQVNLSKMATKLDVAAESAGQSLMTYTQVLDSDGKFYDSVGAKSRKVIIVGENQGAPGISQDAKINVKITYFDGSVQFLGSYCSPNTYLVEQL